MPAPLYALIFLATSSDLPHITKRYSKTLQRKYSSALVRALFSIYPKTNKSSIDTVICLVLRYIYPKMLFKRDVGTHLTKTGRNDPNSRMSFALPGLIAPSNCLIEWKPGR